MPSQEWNEIQIENSTGNAPKIANRMKNGATAAYCGRACRYLFGGLSTEVTVVLTAAGAALLVTAMSDRPRSGEFALDLAVGVGPGLVRVLAGGLDVHELGTDRRVDDRVVRREIRAGVLLRGVGEEVDDLLPAEERVGRTELGVAVAGRRRRKQHRVEEGLRLVLRRLQPADERERRLRVLAVLRDRQEGPALVAGATRRRRHPPESLRLRRRVLRPELGPPHGRVVGDEFAVGDDGVLVGRVLRVGGQPFLDDSDGEVEGLPDVVLIADVLPVRCHVALRLLRHPVAVDAGDVVGDRRAGDGLLELLAELDVGVPVGRQVRDRGGIDVDTGLGEDVAAVEQRGRSGVHRLSHHLAVRRDPELPLPGQEVLLELLGPEVVEVVELVAFGKYVATSSLIATMSGTRDLPASAV